MSHKGHYPRKHYQYLHVPDHWEQYWSKYPNGYTVLEALISWTSQVNAMVKTLNKTTDHVLVLDRQFRALDKELRAAFEGFKEYVEEDQQEFKDEVHTIINNFIASIDPRIQDIVVDSLTGWLGDGTLADIINEDVFNMKADKEQLDTVKRIITPDMTTNEIRETLLIGRDFKFTSGVYELDFHPLISEPTCLDLPSNISIEFEKGTILKSPATDSDRYYLLRIRDKENITLSGGVLIGDRDTHTGIDGEWGYGLIVYNSQNIEVENMHAQDFWGDGFAVQNRSSNITMTNCVADNNRRQGLTIGHVDNFKVKGCTFKNTNGTLPEAGVDIEPGTFGGIKGLSIDDCSFVGNNGSGLEINIMQMLTNTDNEEFIDIKGSNNTFEDNNAAIAYTTGGRVTTGKLQGLITFNNTLMRNNTSGLRHANIRKDINPRMVLNGVEIDNWNSYSHAINYYVTIDSDGADSANVKRYGGLEINGLKLVNSPVQTSNPGTSIRVQTNSEGRPIDLYIDGLETDNVDLGRVAYWNYGEGHIKYKAEKPFYKVGAVTGTGIAATQLNGLSIGNRQGYNLYLPNAKGYKGREFTFTARENSFLIRPAQGSSDLIKGVATDTLLEIFPGNTFTLKSDGVSQWELVEQVGGIKRSAAADTTRIYTSSSTHPTSGPFDTGTLILNSNPNNTVGGEVLIGWYRATTSSNHVLGVDWVELKFNVL